MEFRYLLVLRQLIQRMSPFLIQRTTPLHLQCSTS